MPALIGVASTNGKSCSDLSRGISVLADEASYRGFATTDGKGITIETQLESFGSEGEKYAGNAIAGIGVTKSTTDQPRSFSHESGEYAVVLDCQYNNFVELFWQLPMTGDEIWERYTDGEISPEERDVELTVALVAQMPNLAEGISNALIKVAGNINGLFLTPDGIVAASGVYGLSRLAIGAKDGALAVSTHPNALCNGSGLGYHYVRDLNPGEVVLIGPNGLETISTSGLNVRTTRCWFRWVRDGSPDSVVDKIPINQTRNRLAARLAETDVAGKFKFGRSDSVVGSAPACSEDYASGYATALGLDHLQLFDLPAHETGQPKTDGLKPRKEYVRGKRVILLDISLSSTTPELVQKLLEAGASEVHLRLVTSKIVRACPYDFLDEEELLVPPLSDGNIQDKVGATSVRFLHLPKETGKQAEASPFSKLCTACIKEF